MVVRGRTRKHAGRARPRQRHYRRKAELWDSFKSARNWIKSNTVISSLVGVGSTAATLGYGRRRRVGRPRTLLCNGPTVTTLAKRRCRRKVLAPRVYFGLLRSLAMRDSLKIVG